MIFAIYTSWLQYIIVNLSSLLQKAGPLGRGYCYREKKILVANWEYVILIGQYRSKILLFSLQSTVL